MKKNKMMSCLALSILCLSSCAKKNCGITSTSFSSSTSSSNAIICNHTYGNWKMVKEPTSTTTGEIKRKCNDCDNEETFILPILNKTDYSYSIDKESTCKTKGIGRYTYLKDDDKFDILIDLDLDIFNHVEADGDGNCLECKKFVAIRYEYLVNTCTVKKVGSLDENNLVHSLRHLVIPKTVTHEGQEYKVTGIESNAFRFSNGTQGIYNINSLRSVDIQAEITELYDAFFYCDSLEKVTLPNTLKTIDKYAFVECKSLKSIDLPESVETINVKAFQNCSSLSSFYLPKNVNSLIGNEGFNGCTSLVKIEVDPSNTKYTSLGDDNNECNAIIEKETNTLVYGCKSTVIPDNIEIIGIGAFLNCTGLEEITIPVNVKTIVDGAFKGCSSLKKIYIPKNVISIAANAFSYCTSLEEIVVDTDNASYDSRDNCNAIIETSSNTLLFGCKNTNIVPSGVTSIASYAFSKQSDLETLEMANSVTSIGYGAFENCESLKSVKLSNNLSTIATRAFMNCYSLESIVIPSSVSNISRMVFENCSSLKNVDIPSSVTSIDDRAFNGCSSLEYALIPPTITYIGASAFLNSTTLFVKGSKEETSSELKAALGQSLFYYSENEPDSTTTDSYWHYDSNNKPVKW